MVIDIFIIYCNDKKFTMFKNKESDFYLSLGFLFARWADDQCKFAVSEMLSNKIDPSSKPNLKQRASQNYCYLYNNCYKSSLPHFLMEALPIWKSKLFLAGKYCSAIKISTAL